MMKRFLTLAVILSVCVFAQAQTYDYLVFTTTDDEIAVLSEGAVITFTDGNLIVTNEQESQTIPLATLVKFCFSHDTTGIEAIFSTLGTGSVEVYTTAGGYVGRFVYTPGEPFPLTKGVYILKGEQGSKKLIVK